MRLSRSAIMAVLVFVTAFSIYHSNVGNLETHDSAPTSLFVMNAVEHRTFDFDDFRGSYLDVRPGYPLIRIPGDHLESIFPIGTAILTSPAYLLLEVARVGHREPDITASAFEQIASANEKLVANLVGAAAALLFFLCAIRLSTLISALLATCAFAFGSEMWTIGSQALWQHGSVALVTLAMVLALLRFAQRDADGFAIFVAGVCAGFLPVIRPTALVFTVAGLAFSLRYAKKYNAYFIVGAAIGVLPGVLWNIGVYHGIVGGYAVNESSYTFSFAQAKVAFAGLLVSPNRGLLVFSPFVAFSLCGAILMWRTRTAEATVVQLMTIASTALFVSYLFFQRWQGGSTFGPRYLTELMPTACLLLLFVLPRDLRGAPPTSRAVFALACVAIVLSIGVQAAGANGEPKTNWSGVPIDLSLAPERVWQWDDSQIERDARATYRLWRSNPTFPTAYAAGYDGRIISISANGAPVESERFSAPAKATVRFGALLKNIGTSRWYGYQTGLYYGLTHVRLRYETRSGQIALERYLAVDGAPTIGETTTAIGDVDVPATPGTYDAVFDIDAYQDARIGSRHIGARTIAITVR